MKNNIENMPDRIIGKSIHSKVIPTVCNLENMLIKLENVSGDFSQLKQWEKRSYLAYNIDAIKLEILNAREYDWPILIRNHILIGDKSKFGAGCIDIYLVAYVANEYGAGKNIFAKYILNSEITDKINTVNAIWTVGKGDGVYLGILHKDGSIKDYEFIRKWIAR